MKVTAIVAPLQSDPGLGMAVSPRQFDAVDDFIAALGRELGVPIPIVEGTLMDAPAEGLIIAFDAAELSRHRDLVPRVILINVDRSQVPRSLETHDLCAAVEKHRYFQWRTDRSTERGSGLFGRKNVAALMGATLSSAFQSERYGMLSSERHADLPALLAGYIAAYEDLFAQGSR